MQRACLHPSPWGPLWLTVWLMRTHMHAHVLVHEHICYMGRFRPGTGTAMLLQWALGRMKSQQSPHRNLTGCGQGPGSAMAITDTHSEMPLLSLHSQKVVGGRLSPLPLQRPRAYSRPAPKSLPEKQLSQRLSAAPVSVMAYVQPPRRQACGEGLTL